jgi:hypothetical protein
VRYKTYVEILSRALVMRQKLLEKVGTKQTSITNEPDETNPEPWFDLSASAPSSMNTEHTKDTRHEKDEAETPKLPE